jgi:hypothetical protein
MGKAVRMSQNHGKKKITEKIPELGKNHRVPSDLSTNIDEAIRLWEE